MSRPVQIAGGGVSILFAPAGDRFTQKITLGGETLLTAVDEASTAHESWPPSPPLQDVHLEQRPDGRQLALMVGRAGTSHWSISCELHASAGEVLFDVACRIKEPASWLGSMYQLAPGVTFQGDDRAGELQQDNRMLCHIAAYGDCEIVWELASGRLILTPLIGSEEAFPRTIRWRYKLLPAAAAD